MNQLVICDACHEEFSVPVWHCPRCDHHWPYERVDCWNCHAYARPSLRVICCGGRDYSDRDAVVRRLGGLPPDTTIIVGCSLEDEERHWPLRLSADLLVAQTARGLGLRREECPADWKQYGKAAGPKRNAAMLASGADLVIAFPGGKGTADMVARARAADVPVEEIAG